MDAARRTLLMVAVVIVATLSLYAEGVVKQGWIEPILLAPTILLFVRGTSVIAQNLLLSLASVCLSVSACDVALRPFMGEYLHYSPFNAYTRKLPELPVVGRWDPNINTVSKTYGDLAAMSGQADFREWRQITFQTDEAGFRNQSRSGRIDLLILGDSFGAGGGTTQDKMFSSVLEAQHGLRVYNLSYPGSPYYEFVNFAIESPKLSFSSHATVVWTWYTGNDLADPAGDIFAIDELPWNNRLRAWLVKYRTYRNRSPLNQWSQAITLKLTKSHPDVVVRTLPNGEPILFFRSQDMWGVQSKQAIEEHPNFSRSVKALEAMARLTAKQGLNLVLLVLPTKGEVYPWILEERVPMAKDEHESGFAEAVLAACVRLHVECLDTKPYLVDKSRRLFASSGRLLWWRDDTHLASMAMLQWRSLLLQMF